MIEDFDNEESDELSRGDKIFAVSAGLLAIIGFFTVLVIGSTIIENWTKTKEPKKQYINVCTDRITDEVVYRDCVRKELKETIK